MIQKRNIAVCILLSIATCGIYSLIWIYQITNETAFANENKHFNGTIAALLTVLTCGFYGLYWNYKMGKEIYEAKTKKGLNAYDNSALYLFLTILGFSIINYCLMQVDLNEIAEQ